MTDNADLDSDRRHVDLHCHDQQHSGGTPAGTDRIGLASRAPPRQRRSAVGRPPAPSAMPRPVPLPTDGRLDGRRSHSSSRRDGPVTAGSRRLSNSGPGQLELRRGGGYLELHRHLTGAGGDACRHHRMRAARHAPPDDDTAVAADGLLRHLAAPARIDLAARDLSQHRRRQLRRSPRAPTPPPWPQGDPRHTDHHEPAHRAGSSAGASRQPSTPTTATARQSVTSNTPAVCSTNGLAVTYVGVGTCSLNAQVAGRHQLSGGLWLRPDLHDRAGQRDHADHHRTSLRPPTSSSASRPSWARPATARPRSPRTRRRCAASAATGSRSRSWDSAPVR